MAAASPKTVAADSSAARTVRGEAPFVVAESSRAACGTIWSTSPHRGIDR